MQALEEVMPCEQYLSALMSLLGSPEEAIVTRALRLFQTSLATPATGEATSATMHFCDQVSSQYSVASKECMSMGYATHSTPSWDR